MTDRRGRFAGGLCQAVIAAQNTSHVAASLAQIGEFSFILAGLGLSLGLLPPAGQSPILAGALISIALNPLLFSAVEPLRGWIRAHSALARELERRDDPLAELPMSTDRKFLAKQVVIATPQTLEVRQMVETARALNPTILVAVRSHNQEEAALLEREHAGKVFVGETELARSMTAYVIARVGIEQ